MTDIRIENHGSVTLIRPLSAAGLRWVEEHIQVEDWQWQGGAVAAEPRYVASIAEGAKADGLKVAA